MMVSVETYLRRGQRRLRQWTAIPWVRPVLRVFGYGVTGFLFSAVSLGNVPQPLAMGLCCAVSGWRAIAVSLGSILGYRVFWQEQGLQGMLWGGLGGLLGLLHRHKSLRDMPLLIPSMAAFLVSALGLAFQVLWLEEVSFGIYALRVALAGGSAVVLEHCVQRVLNERVSRRGGRTGYAQVRLELTAGVLADTQQLLLETTSSAIDEAALLEKVRYRACGACAAQKDCREREHLSVHHLHQPLDFACRKSGRILGELRRGREQLLSLRREKERLREYRWALIQQYRFLSEHIRALSDDLQTGPLPSRPRYRILVSARSRSKELSNGDRCLAFPGTGCRYYVALCDGMGTGMGAAREGQSAAQLLQKMLTAGFPAEQALRSINSLLTLRGQAGAVTLDLAEAELDTGRVSLYKWGAAPSWLLSHRGMEQLGTATAPPGISIDSGAQTLSVALRREETLILLSDGATIQEASVRGKLSRDMPPGDIAAAIVKLSQTRGEDDATAAVLRLERLKKEAALPPQ